MHTARLVTKDGATREFIMGHPQQNEHGDWFLSVWPVDDLHLSNGETDD